MFLTERPKPKVKLNGVETNPFGAIQRVKRAMEKQGFPASVMEQFALVAGLEDVVKYRTHTTPHAVKDRAMRAVHAWCEIS